MKQVKNKIYYLARSYYPYDKGGGAMMRAGAVKYLKELGWKVMVVMPNYNSQELIIDNNIVQIPFKIRHIQKLASLFERTGIYEDYLDKWIENAFHYLKDKIIHKDTILATSGGELGMIKLASLLKEEIGCKFVVNFRDPLNYGFMNGLRRDTKLHFGREKAQEKYISNADLIITSSEYYATVLKKRFTYLADIIHNNYFGYIKEINLDLYKKKESNKLRIAYVGMMSNTQKPELLYEVYKKLDNKDIEIYFIGNTKNYAPLKNINDKNVHFIEYLQHENFLKFMCENIDVGFLSLINDYYAACVPSKLYEYINLGLPIIGALPEGDAMNIINKNGYGIVQRYDDVSGLVQSIEKLQKNKNLRRIKIKILKDKNKWYMKNKILEISREL